MPHLRILHVHLIHLIRSEIKKLHFYNSEEKRGIYDGLGMLLRGKMQYVYTYSCALRSVIINASVYCRLR